MSLNCQLLIQAVAQRNTQLIADGEKQLSEKFSNLMETEDDLFALNQKKHLERESLETYNVILIACFEKLLYLSNEKVKNNFTTENGIFARPIFEAAINYTGLLALVSNGTTYYFYMTIHFSYFLCCVVFPNRVIKVLCPSVVQ